MAAPRRHLALVCFLHQAWRDTLDQAVDMYGKLLDRNRKLVEERLDDMLKAQRHAVDRIVQRYRRLGAVLLDSDVGDDELHTRLLSIVPEEQLREDQSDLNTARRGAAASRRCVDRALQPLIRRNGVTDRRRWEKRAVPQGPQRDPDRQPRH